MCVGTAEGKTAGYGVAALSGTDGHVRWVTPVAGPRAGANLIADLVAANDTVALLQTYDESNRTPATLVAVDVATGRRLWKRAGASAAALAGNTVLAWQRTTQDQDVDASPAVLMTLDATAGTVMWRTRGPLKPAVSITEAMNDIDPVVTAAGGIAVLPTVGSDGNVHEQVVDVRTGRELAALDSAGSCAIDDHSGGDALVACLSGNPALGYRIASFRPGDHQFRVSKRLVRGRPADIDAVWKGYIFIKPEQATEVFVDDAGNVLGSNVPGRVLAISDQYAVFGSDSGSAQYNVRRLTH